MNSIAKRHKTKGPSIPSDALCVGKPGAEICHGCARRTAGPRGPKHMTFAPAVSDTSCIYRKTWRLTCEECAESVDGQPGNGACSVCLAESES